MENLINEITTKKYNPIKNLLCCVGLYILICVIYILTDMTGNALEYEPISRCMVVAIIVIAITCVIESKKKYSSWLNPELLICGIVATGVIMRIGYMLYSTCLAGYDVVQYNVELLKGDEKIVSKIISSLTRDENIAGVTIKAKLYPTGHGGYLLQLFNNNSLPQSNDYQFYQQPLYYVLGSFTMKLINPILNISKDESLIEIAKIISCLSSCIILFVVKDFLNRIDCKDNTKLIILPLIAFLPSFYIVSSYVSPDALTLLFIILEITYTCYWYKDHTWKNTIALALFYGFGLMTKISCGLIAPITGFVFIYVFLKENESKSELLKKYFVFLLLSVPLGLWYNCRNFIRFNQNFGYVFQQAINSDFYTGKHSLLERLFFLDVNNLVSSPFVFQTSDYNLPVYYIKSAIFGNSTFYEIDTLLVSLVLYCSFLIVFLTGAFCVFCFLYRLILRKNTYFQNILLFVSILSYIAIIWFNFNEPFVSTMAFRYYAFTMLPIATMFGYSFENLNNRKLKDGMEILVLLFSISSILLYLI